MSRASKAEELEAAMTWFRCHVVRAAVLLAMSMHLTHRCCLGTERRAGACAHRGAAAGAAVARRRRHPARLLQGAPFVLEHHETAALCRLRTMPNCTWRLSVSLFVGLASVGLMQQVESPTRLLHSQNLEGR